MVLVRGGITVKPHVQRAANEVVAEFGAGLSPGTYNGHSPPEGPTQALDLFNQVNASGWALQGRVADYLIRNAKRLGVRYVIKWNPNGADLIWNIERAGEGWRAMATRDHKDHVHVTFYAKAADVIVDDKPGVPDDDDKEMGMAATWFRYIYDGQDYVVDRISRTFSLTTDLDQLKELDALGCVERGKKSKAVHDYWKGMYGGD